MASSTTYKIKFKRRRQGITDYAKRLRTLKGKKNKVVIRITNNNIISQVIKYQAKGDETIINTTALELKKYNYKGHKGNKKAAYLTGYLCGKKAIKKGIKEANPDIGLRTPVHKSNVFAVIKGLIDSGLKMNYDKKALPEIKEVEEIKKEIDKKY